MVSNVKHIDCREIQICSKQPGWEGMNQHFPLLFCSLCSRSAHERMGYPRWSLLSCLYCYTSLVQLVLPHCQITIFQCLISCSPGLFSPLGRQVALQGPVVLSYWSAFIQGAAQSVAEVSGGCHIIWESGKQQDAFRCCSATQNPLVLTTQKFSGIEMVCLSSESFWGSGAG